MLWLRVSSNSRRTHCNEDLDGQGSSLSAMCRRLCQRSSCKRERDVVHGRRHSDDARQVRRHVGDHDVIVIICRLPYGNWSSTPEWRRIPVPSRVGPAETAHPKCYIQKLSDSIDEYWQTSAGTVRHDRRLCRQWVWSISDVVRRAATSCSVSVQFISDDAVSKHTGKMQNTQENFEDDIRDGNNSGHSTNKTIGQSNFTMSASNPSIGTLV